MDQRRGDAHLGRRWRERSDGTWFTGGLILSGHRAGMPSPERKSRGISALGAADILLAKHHLSPIEAVVTVDIVPKYLSIRSPLSLT